MDRPTVACGQLTETVLARVDGHHQLGIDQGEWPGTTTEAERIRKLEQENRELRRANEILKSARQLGRDIHRGEIAGVEITATPNAS